MHCKICGDYSCEKTDDIHSLVAYGTEEDENGFFHYHNKNYRWQEWKCRQGHIFRTTAFNACWCGWSSQYPDVCSVKFKPPDKIKGWKFSSHSATLNKEWISSQMKAIEKIMMEKNHEHENT